MCYMRTPVGCGSPLDGTSRSARSAGCGCTPVLMCSAALLARAPRQLSTRGQAIGTRARAGANGGAAHLRQQIVDDDGGVDIAEYVDGGAQAVQKPVQHQQECDVRDILCCV